MKTRIQHPEYRIQKAEGRATDGTRTKRSVEPIFGVQRWEEGGPEVGKRGKKDGRGRVFPAFSHHFPAFPTFSHFIFICMMNMKIRPTPCPLPCCAWKGWAYGAVLPRVATKRHGA